MGFARLCSLSSIMLFSTLVIGHFPLTLSSAISQKRIKQISIYGVGLLVGAALTIIIPEGVDAVYESRGEMKSQSEGVAGHSHEGKGGLVGVALISGFLLMYLIDQLHSTHQSPQQHDSPLRPSSRRRAASTDRPLLSRASSCSFSRMAPKQSNKTLKCDIESFGRDHDAYDSQPEDYFPPDSTLSQPSLMSHSAMPTSQGGAKGRRGTSPSSRIGKRSWSTTVGLMAHSVADGISLGASSAIVVEGQPELSTLDLVIFMAIMVHKAPAAFGMVAVLMSQGMPKRKIRHVLLAFSAAAPFGAILTWGLIQLAVGSGTLSEHDGQTHEQVIEWWTGMALLFSGGTFLFVATHVLQNSGESCDQQPGSQNGIEHGSCDSTNDSPHDGAVDVGRWSKTVLMTLGMLSPLALTRAAGHGH